MNIHYKNRYDKFITSIQRIGKRVLEYSENHHIIPKCQGGGNETSNMIRLSLREHYIAHLLLAKTYMTWNLMSAFVQMDIKNPRVIHKEKFVPKSRIYEKYRKKFHTLIGKQNIGKVHVRDENGNKVVLSKEEYAESDYEFHTTGMVGAKNNMTGMIEWISCEEYRRRDELKSGFGIGVSIFKIRDKLTQEIIEVSYNDYSENYKNVKALVDGKIRPLKRYVVIKNGNIRSRAGISNEHIPVFDLKTNTRTSVTKQEYYDDVDRYLTVSKNRPPVWDTVEQRYCTVSNTDFDGVRYVGVTKGFTTVFDKQENRYRPVSREEFSSNRDRYSGVCSGKLNVVFKETGIRKQIPKEIYDEKLHCVLGRTKLLFKCRNLLTNKEMNVSIYEWKFIGDQYEIIQIDKFNQIKHLIQ